MSNEIKIYEKAEFGNVRTFLDEQNEIWFCGADVCKVLEYDNVSKAVRDHVDKGDVTKRYSTHAKGGNFLLYVNESGLYSLIMGSKMPRAKEFKHWVTSEVLPSIRQTGAYQAPTPALQPTFSPLQLRQLADHIEGLEQTVAQQNNTIQQQQSAMEVQCATISEQQAIIEAKDKVIAMNEKKSEYLDLILSSTDALTISQIAMDYGISGKAMNAYLHAIGIQYKQNKQWLLYADYVGKGYVKSVSIQRVHANGQPFTIQHTLWTQRGRAFLYHALKKRGILPSMEKKTA